MPLHMFSKIDRVVKLLKAYFLKLRGRKIKKNPRINSIDSGMPLSIHVSQPPLSTGTLTMFSGRSSDFRIILLIAPSRSFMISGILQCSSPVTATGSFPIYTGFPFNPYWNLKNVVFLTPITLFLSREFKEHFFFKINFVIDFINLSLLYFSKFLVVAMCFFNDTVEKSYAFGVIDDGHEKFIKENSVVFKGLRLLDRRWSCEVGGKPECKRAS